MRWFRDDGQGKKVFTSFALIPSYLMGNAVKFTDSGEIKISACQVNGDFKLAVADTGIGIDKADTTRIFKEFAELAPGR